MSTARVVMRSIWRKASGKYALTVLGLWVLVSLVSLVWTPHTLLETDGFHAWASPSAAHPLGTDGVGADVLRRGAQPPEQIAEPGALFLVTRYLVPDVKVNVFTDHSV